MDTQLTDQLDAWRHPVNVGHLVMGIAFAGLVVVWAVLQADVVELSDARWLLPLPWVVAGAVGLVAATANARRPRPHRTPADPSQTYTPHPADPSQPDTEPAADASSENPDDTEPTKEIR